MKRTTIFADEEMLAKLQRLALNKEVSMAELIRTALEAFIEGRPRPKRLPSFVGIGRSGRRDVSEKIDELLWRDSRLKKRAQRS